MGTSLSSDLRMRVVAAVEGGMSRRAAAAQFRVAVSSAVRWVAQARATGSVASKTQGGDRRSKAIEMHAGRILDLVAAKGDITLRELQAALEQDGSRFSLAAFSRFFRRHAYSRKKRPRTPASRTALTS